MKLFDVLQHAVTIVSSESFQVSLFLPICFAAKSELDRVIREVGEQVDFEQLFGEESLKILQDTMVAQIDLDGKTAAGREVELLDPYQL